MILPTHKQLECCDLWGWKYIGDGLFGRGELIGYFTDKGFIKE